MTSHVLVLESPHPHRIRAHLHSTVDDDDSEAFETDIEERWLLQLWPGTNRASQIGQDLL